MNANHDVNGAVILLNFSLSFVFCKMWFLVYVNYLINCINLQLPILNLWTLALCFYCIISVGGVLLSSFCRHKAVALRVGIVVQCHEQHAS